LQEMIKLTPPKKSYRKGGNKDSLVAVHSLQENGKPYFPI